MVFSYLEELRKTVEVRIASLQSEIQIWDPFGYDVLPNDTPYTHYLKCCENTSIIRKIIVKYFITNSSSVLPRI
jgi:hypothetical protein